MKHVIGTRWLANPSRGRNHFPHDFGAYMSILFIIKVKIPMFNEWSSSPPPINFTLLSLEWLSHFEHLVQNFSECMLLLVFVPGATPDHAPFKYRCPVKICNQIRHVCVTKPEVEHCT